MDLLGKNLQWVQDIDYYFQNGFILIILDSHIEDMYPTITHKAYYTIHFLNNITWRNCFQLTDTKDVLPLPVLQLIVTNFLE